MGEQMKEQDKERLIAILIEAGLIDGAHHKQWAIDQALRALLGVDYEFLSDVHDNWDQGIAP